MKRSLKPSGDGGEQVTGGLTRGGEHGLGKKRFNLESFRLR